MSIIVKGMEMPNSCAVCSFAGRGGYHMERIACMFTGKNENAIKVNRLPECPLVALPDKHGRLVDADALIEDVDGDLTDSIAEGRAIEKIMDAPTIVEAEGE